MSRDVVLKGDDGETYSYDTIAAGHMILGRAVGWGEAEDWLMSEAASAFRKGNDALADRLRDLARTCAKKESERRREYDDHERENDPQRYEVRMKALGRKA